MENKVWFTSDIHFGHKNVLRFCTKRREKMGIDIDDPEFDDKHRLYLIDQWNKTISKKDTVYILGDFSFYNREGTRRILEKLNGKKHLILGNHDKSCKGLENYFESVSQIKTVDFKKHEYEFLDENFIVEMCHFPIYSWNRRQHGVCHIHGHTHGSMCEINKSSKELRVDVGYDSVLGDLEFISLEKLYNHFKSITGNQTFRNYINKKMEDDGYRL
jgi:calcineurin-like phosphoesterase family protein